MELKLSDESLRSALSEAILSQIGPESRDAMIRESLARLVAPTKGRNDYSSNTGPSEIEQAFARASANLMEGIVTKLVNEDPEIRGLIEALARDSIKKLLSQPNNDLVEAFTRAFGKTLEDKRY